MDQIKPEPRPTGKTFDVIWEDSGQSCGFPGNEIIEAIFILSVCN